MKWYTPIIVIVALLVGIFLGAQFDISSTQGGLITLSIIDAVFLVLAVVSTTLGIVAIVFSWIFYNNSQTLNRKSGDILSDITQKISKIDDIITQQYDKLLAKAIGVKHEGAVSMEDIQILRKVDKSKKKE
jgi:hypothetical protein